MKVTSLRIPDDTAADLDLIARIDDMSVNEAINLAITAYVATRRADPEFQQRLKQHIATVHRLTTDLP